MNFEFLKPINEELLELTQNLPKSTLGKNIKKHTSKSGMPSLKNIQIVLLGVLETRASVHNHSKIKLNQIRKELYRLHTGTWSIKIADLGDLEKGNTVQDTYFALKKITSYLLKKQIIPIIIGGGQDLTHAIYRAYDQLEQTVNLVCVDSKFDLGNLQDPLTSESFLSKVIMQEPNNLFNYSNIAYQTYYNAQEEIELLDSLYFEAYRLGEIQNNIKIVEPVLRDADMVSIDLSAIKNTESPAICNGTPNGLSGENICTIARYAGISDKVTSFGIYEYQPKYDIKNQTAQLIAQIIWYFIEGVNFRANDYPFGTKDKYKKYMVPIENEVLTFYKSHKSGRWWIEIDLSENNKFKRHTLIPCTYKDYLDATKQEIPERWYKTMRKLM